jgi:hypothetical protein
MEAIEDVLVNGDDPMARFATATTTAQEILDKYNAHTLDPNERAPYCLHVDS